MKIIYTKNTGFTDKFSVETRGVNPPKKSGLKKNLVFIL